ncbi:MAG: Nramp family divalent metal transporter [Balneolaceae bacterium]|nr:Nramp family divalent metal transporter [Balneolaceae bacterium]MCH8548332.1 Nramp family divalent metal transporter [Balneolaceae bacterium]
MSGFTLKGLRKAVGPGIIMAAAAIGVSHLVQSTRAGAEFGFALVWAVLLANLFKYPFLEYGPRYALATGRDMIRGYASLHPAALWIFIIFTVSTMFAIQAAVTLVSGSLAGSLTGIDLPVLWWSGIILLICIFLLIRDRYSVLDRAIKIIMVIFAISTMIAMIAAFAVTDYQPDPGFVGPELWTVGGVAFLIALMGWMPIPIDAAAWHSIWSVERVKQTGYKPKLNEALFDFNLGYIGASVIALAFLTLGAMVMYGTGESFASSAAAFSGQLVSLYTLTLGEWARALILICAFTTMFSTTLTVTDTYPRVCTRIVSVLKGEDGYSSSLYRKLLVGIAAGSFLFLLFLGEQFRFLIDLATTLSFLTAPVLAFMNHKLIHSPEVNEEFRPKPWLWWLSISGIIFLSLFAILYLYWMIRF